MCIFLQNMRENIPKFLKIVWRSVSHSPTEIAFYLFEYIRCSSRNLFVRRRFLNIIAVDFQFSADSFTHLGFWSLDFLLFSFRISNFQHLFHSIYHLDKKKCFIFNCFLNKFIHWIESSVHCIALHRCSKYVSQPLTQVKPKINAINLD